MVPSKMIFKIVVLFSCGLLTSCFDAEIHEPNDQVAELCAAGRYGTTKFRCVGNDGTLEESVAMNLSPSSKALFMFIEPGDYATNQAMQDESVRMISANMDPKYRYLLRQLMINLALGHQKMLIDTFGSKYDVIYLARSNQVWTSGGFLKGVENVVRNHATVDLYLMVHGSAGRIALNPQLSTQVSTSDILSLKDPLSAAALGRVRSIFLTACFADTAPSGGIAVTSALANAFPQASVYGSAGVNYGPLHRDMLAFEFYYQGLSFQNALSLGNYYLKNNISGSFRTRLVLPVMSVRGQARYMGFTKSQTINLPLRPFEVSALQLENSVGLLKSPSAEPVLITSVRSDRANDALARVKSPKSVTIRKLSMMEL